MDEVHPQLVRAMRRGDADDFAIQCDAPAIWLRQTGQNPDQRRFAGAIGADKAMHLAGPQKEGNAFQRTDAAIGLGDIFNIQKRGRRRRPLRLWILFCQHPNKLIALFADSVRVVLDELGDIGLRNQ